MRNRGFFSAFVFWGLISALLSSLTVYFAIASYHLETD